MKNQRHEGSKKTIPASIQIALILITIQAIYWLVFAIVLSLGWVQSIPASGTTRWIMVLLGLACSLILAGTALLLSMRKPLAYYFALILMILIAGFSIMDQTGWMDILSLLMNISALILLIKGRGWIIHESKE